MSSNYAESLYHKTMANHSNILKRIADVERQMEVQREALALVPKDIDSNKTICYYRGEKERVDRKIDAENASIDNQIAALEARRRAIMDKLEKERTRYETEIITRTQQLENPEPQTPAYRKLTADLTTLRKEEKEAHREMTDAGIVMRAEMDKRMKYQQKQIMEEYDRKQREVAAAEAEERRKIEEMNDRKMQEQQKLIEEAAKRVGKPKIQSASIETLSEEEQTEITMKAIENAYPKKIPRIEKKGKQLKKEDLNIHSAYTTSDLSTLPDLDYENDDPRYIEIYEKLWTDACVREKREGWWNHDR